MDDFQQLLEVIYHAIRIVDKTIKIKKKISRK